MAGLLHYFEGVFGREVVEGYHSKQYRPITEREGFSDEDALQKVVVIGDARGDQPQDLGLVFVDHKMGYLFDAALASSILTKLLEVGEGDFSRGFEFLYRHANAEVTKPRNI